jgi:DNA-binding response OmpR family regulator
MSDGTADEPTRVLLIEDDAEFAEMYRLRLEADEYLVEWARDGAEGLAMARDWHPDLVFLDIRMPKIDGLELLALLRADAATQDLPVVVLSNYGDERLKGEGRRLGILEWRSKVDTTPGGMSAWIERWTGALDAEA